MNDLRTAAQQALEAWFRPNGINYVDFKPYMEALRAALAGPEQEPVAWYDSISGQTDFTSYKPHRKPSSPSAEWIPLYAAPTPRKPLTDEEIEDLYFDGFSISKLKEFARAIERAHGITGAAP